MIDFVAILVVCFGLLTRSHQRSSSATSFFFYGLKMKRKVYRLKFYLQCLRCRSHLNHRRSSDSLLFSLHLLLLLLSGTLLRPTLRLLLRVFPHQIGDSPRDNHGGADDAGSSKTHHGAQVARFSLV